LKSLRRPELAPDWRGRLLAWLASCVTLIVPRSVGYWLVERVGTLLYLLKGSYRRAVLANMAQVLGRPTTDPAVRAAARGCFQTSARNFWDVCSLPHRSPYALLQRTEIDPAAWERLRARLAEGRGLILVTAHLGAFDYVGQLLIMLGTRPLIPTQQTTSGWLFEAVTVLRSSWGSIVEPASAGLLRRILAYLRQGGLVGLISDRDIQRSGRPVAFFGQQTTLPAGPVRLALQTGAPVVAMFCPREGDHYRLLIEEMPVERSGDLEHDLEVNQARLAALLERTIQRWPEQWVIFQRVWPEEPWWQRLRRRRRTHRT
jgi:KDO2-lipid IV(A) lauroyltransferase